MYTVHVLDMCRAIWHACLHGKSGEIYHIVDKGNTSKYFLSIEVDSELIMFGCKINLFSFYSAQGKISEIVSDIFNINHDYFGTAMSTLAKVKFHSYLIFNDKLMFVCMINTFYFLG